MFDIDDLLIYHPNIILTSDVYDILDNMHKYLCNWTFNFRKVVRQQIWGEVVDFNVAFFQFIWECNSENIVKIGPYLPKLLQEIFGAVFLAHPVYTVWPAAGTGQLPLQNGVCRTSHNPRSRTRPITRHHYGSYASVCPYVHVYPAWATVRKQKKRKKLKLLWTLPTARVKRGFHPTQRTQRTQRNGHNAMNATDGTDATTDEASSFDTPSFVINIKSCVCFF